MKSGGGEEGGEGGVTAMGETFRPIGRGEREKLKSPAQSTRILGPALPIDPDTRLGFDWVDRQLTRYTVSMIETCLLYLIERNLPVISNRTESNGEEEIDDGE